MLHLFLSYTLTRHKYNKVSRLILPRNSHTCFPLGVLDFHSIIMHHTVSLGIIPYHCDL